MISCCDCWVKFFGFIAIAFLALYIRKVFYRLIHPFFIAETPDIHGLAGGTYAVVTGSTDGIGREYAVQLANKGFNLVLISRSEDKLAAVKKEISEKIEGINIETIAFDFTNTEVKDYESKIFEKLKNLDVGVLVNNVGLSVDFPHILHKSDGDVQKSRNMITVNILPATLLTHEVLKQMIPRNKGVIINIGSVAGCDLMPQVNVYSSTKKYLEHFTAILTKEYRNTGLTIQYISPGIVCTKMSQATVPSFFEPNPKTYVESTLKTVGVIGETSGYIGHQIIIEFVRLIPSLLSDFALEKFITKRREDYFKKNGGQVSQ
uniref:Estradiol 17-beta-dehydrogenase 12 n=1 Tax=Rhabditophanes sp. KR3021 TaxID=114890 RepID=A0AC35TTX0_9BILA